MPANKYETGEYDTGVITISIQQYEQLIDDQRLLTALEVAGVDNWEGYSAALELYQRARNDE